MATTSPRDHLAAARLAALRRFPYYRSALLALIPRATPGLGTLGVSEHGVMMWDPEAVGQWSVEELGTILVHEATHLLRRHAARCRAISADPEVWNIAADCEINDDLKAAGCAFPGDGLLPDRLGLPEGRTAEEYYRMLGEQQKSRQEGQEQKQGQGQGQGRGQKQNQGQGQGQKERGPCSGRCGGCAGNPQKGEEEADAEMGGGRSEAELRRATQQTAEAVRKHSESKGQGSVPDGIGRWAEVELTPPKVRWQDMLARIVRSACAYRPGAVDYSYSRTSRRQAGVGFGPGRPVLPALVAPRPRVAIIIDTSGSMSDKELGDALTETRGILQAVGGEVELGTCDAQLHALRPVGSWQEAAKLLQGGGGTDFRPALDALRRRPRGRIPDVVVYLTDGDGTAPEAPPPFRVVWALVGTRPERPASWGDCVEIEAPKGA